jgi:hypothetical protein
MSMRSSISRNVSPYTDNKFTDGSEELNVSSLCQQVALPLVPFYLLAFAFPSTMKMQVVHSSQR